MYLFHSILDYKIIYFLKCSNYIQITLIQTTMSFFSNFGFQGFPHQGDDDDDHGEVDNNKFYDVLGVQKTASQDEIKKAYLQLVKKHHPDRGGNKEKFNQIKEAYQTLGDPEKREVYDQYGSKGPGQSQEDMLNMFFGGGGMGRPGGKKQLPKVKATAMALEVTLQEIYNGEMKKVPITRTRNCQKCNGKGGENVKKCATCRGQGQVIKMYQVRPGMYSQVQQDCSDCKGQGQTIGKKCAQCQGKKIKKNEKQLEVAIEKGSPNNNKITFSGEGNQIPGALAGDIIIVLKEANHKDFTRNGADLFMKKTISLAEALCGSEFTIKHLDGTEFSITTQKGDIIGDHTKKTVIGLGMPFFKDPMSHGNLIIQFTVQMPKRGQLTKQQIQTISKLLPGKVNPRPKDDNYQMLQDYDAQNANTNQEGGRKPQEQQQAQEQAEHGCGTQ